MRGFPAKLVGDRREQAEIRGHQPLAGVHQQKTARSIRVLNLARAEARLAYKRRLLIAENSGEPNPCDCFERCFTIDFAARTHLRKHCTRNVKRGERSEER